MPCSDCCHWDFKIGAKERDLGHCTNPRVQDSLYVSTLRLSTPMVSDERRLLRVFFAGTFQCRHYTKVGS
jgi:hypothetical protein